jgi:hypothetical protein
MEVSGQLHTLTALPPGKNPHSRFIGGYVGPRAGLDVVVKSKSNHNHPVVELVVSRYAD